MADEKQVIIVGSAGVGKTTLAKALTSPPGKFNFDTLRVRPTILGNHTGEGFKFHDAGGKPAYDMLRLSIYRRDNIHAVLVCFALNDVTTYETVLTKFVSEAGNATTRGSTSPPLLLVGCKSDFGFHKPSQSVIDAYVSTERLSGFYKVSSKTGEGLSELREGILGAESTEAIKRVAKGAQPTVEDDLVARASARLKSSSSSGAGAGVGAKSGSGSGSSSSTPFSTLSVRPSASASESGTGKGTSPAKGPGGRAIPGSAFGVKAPAPVPKGPGGRVIPGSAFGVKAPTPAPAPAPTPTPAPIVKKPPSDSHSDSSSSSSTSSSSKADSDPSPAPIVKKPTPTPTPAPIVKKPTPTPIVKKPTPTPAPIVKKPAASASESDASASASSESESSSSSSKRRSRGRRGLFGRRKKAVVEEQVEEILEPDARSHEVHFAAFESDQTRLIELVMRGVNVNMKDKKNLCTPLHYACLKNAVACVRALLGCREIDANGFNKTGHTPLAIAARRDFHTIVECLIKSGKADQEKTTRGGDLPRDLCTSPQTIRVFEVQAQRELAFLMGVQFKNLDAVRLGTGKVNVNCRNEHGETALQIALKSPGNEEIVNMLVSSGADFRESTFAGAPAYLEMMQSKFRARKREEIIVELLKTEKVFLSELRVLVTHFATPFVSKSARMIRNATSRQKIGDLFASLTMILQTNTKLLRGLMAEVPAQGSFELGPVLELFQPRKFKIESYLTYVQHQVWLTTEGKKLKDYSSFWTWTQAQEKKVPFPVRFLALISQPRLRVAKYQGYIARLSQFTDATKDSEVAELLEQVSVTLKGSLDKIEAAATHMKNRYELAEVGKLFKSKYSVTSLDESSRRAYVYHDLNLPIIWSLDAKKRPNHDLFVFNDSLALGDTHRRLTSYSYRECKMIFTVSRDSLRLTVYRDMTIVEDILFRIQTMLVSSWLRELEGTLSHFRFRSQILIVNQLDNVHSIRDFLSLQLDKRDLVGLKQSQLDEARRTLDRFTESKHELEERVAQLERELVDVTRKVAAKRRQREEQKARAMAAQQAALRDAEEASRMAQVQALAEQQAKAERRAARKKGRRAKKQRGSRSGSGLDKFVYDHGASSPKDVPPPVETEETGEIDMNDTRGIDQFKLLQGRFSGAKAEDTFGLRGTRDLDKIFGGVPSSPKMPGTPSPGKTNVTSLRGHFEGKKGPLTMDDIQTDLSRTTAEDEMDVDALLAGETSSFTAAKRAFTGESLREGEGEGPDPGDALAKMMAEMAALEADLDGKV